MADFPNVVLNVTAKQIEDKVNEPIEIIPKEGNLNPIASGAVFNALNGYKAGTRNIQNDAVTPEKLDRFYTEALSTGKINTYAELDDILTPEEGIDPFKTMFKIAFSEQFPNATLADGNDYIGFVSDRLVTETPTLVFVNTETFDKWSYTKGSGTVTEIESVKVDKVYRPESENAQSGIAVKEAVSDAVFTKDLSDTREKYIHFLFDLVKPNKMGERIAFVKIPLLRDTYGGELPEGNYCCIGTQIGTSNHIACWDYVNNRLFTAEQFPIVADGQSLMRARLTSQENKPIIDIGKEFIEYETLKSETEGLDPNIYLCTLGGELPSGLSAFGKAFIQADYGFDENEELAYSVLYCASVFGNKYATIDFLTDTITVTDNSARIENIETQLNGLEEFLATI